MTSFLVLRTCSGGTGHNRSCRGPIHARATETFEKTKAAALPEGVREQPLTI